MQPFIYDRSIFLLLDYIHHFFRVIVVFINLMVFMIALRKTNKCWYLIEIILVGAKIKHHSVAFILFYSSQLLLKIFHYVFSFFFLLWMNQLLMCNEKDGVDRREGFINVQQIYSSLIVTKLHIFSSIFWFSFTSNFSTIS